MLGSRIRILGRTVLNTLCIKSTTSISHKIAVITASVLLLPSCINLASTQDPQPQPQSPNPQPAQQPQQQQPAPIAQQQQPQDRIINYIHGYDDAKKLNLHGNTLIWYECTGEENIDREVVALLEKYVRDNGNNISCPFKVIIDTTPRSRQVDRTNYYKKPVEIVIVKPQNIKPIPLNKYLSYQGTPDLTYSALFQRLTNQINQLTQINIHNLSQLTHSLGTRSYEGLVVMSAPKDSIKYRKARRIFSGFLEEKSMFAAHTSKCIVTDQFSLRYLGLPGYQPGGNNVYILLPDSDNIVKPGRVVTINHRKYHVYTPWDIKQSVVFMPYLEKSSPNSFTLRISADLNQNISGQLSELYEMLGKSEKYPKLADIPKLLVFNPSTDRDRPIEVSLEKNNFDQIVNVYSPECRYSDAEKRALIYSGNRWNYTQSQITPDSLQKWVSEVLDHKVEPNFDSEKKQNTKVKKYNSTRITGEQYVQILNKNREKPKIVFHYSEHCFSCNKFKHFYEELAEEKKNQFDFYRIDNDFNRAQGLVNFNSTPIFAFYKDGRHFLYKNTIFTKALFESFLEITNKIKLIDNNIIDAAVKDRTEHQFNLKQFV